MEDVKKRIVPYIISLLCAGFACTQDVFGAVVQWISSLSMKLNYGWFTALLIVLLVAGGSYQLWIHWRRFKYSDALTAMFLCFVVTMLYFRFIDGDYVYVPLVWKMAYVDVIWILALAFIIESIVNKGVKKPVVSEEECSFLLDSPIETPQEDKFDYYAEALYIANTLSQLPDNKAVSVAVLSPWGNGKTSFVNLIKYAIRHGRDDKPIFNHIIIEFNPRQSKGISSIQEDFFKTLAESFHDETQIRNKLGDYLENIGIQEVHPMVKIFMRLLKGTKKDAANEVNNALDNLKKD